MSFAKFTDLACKSLSGFFARCKGRELFAAGAAADGDKCLDMRVFTLEFSDRCKAAFFAIDHFLIVGPVVKGLEGQSQRMVFPGTLLKSLTRNVPSSLTLP